MFSLEWEPPKQSITPNRHSLHVYWLRERGGSGPSWDSDRHRWHPDLLFPDFGSVFVVVVFFFFCDCLISLSIMSFRFIQVLHMAEFPSFLGWIIVHYVYILYFLYPSVNGHLGCFHIWAVLNNAAVDMGEQVCLWDPDFRSFGYNLEVRLLDHMVIQFSIFSRTFSAIFHSGHNILHSLWISS